MLLKCATAALLIAGFALPASAHATPCPSPDHAAADGQAIATSVVETPADNPFQSADQARLAELLTLAPASDPVQRVRARVLADRGAADSQLALLQQPPLVGAESHYRIQNIVRFSAEQHGDVHRFRVTGSKHGSVWGAGVYTSDSHLGVAAVHAGLLESGETGVVTVRVVNPPSRFVASKRHGVSTHSWGHWDGAFEFVNDTLSVDDSDFVSADQARLSEPQQAVADDPVAQIRAQVRQDREAVSEQVEALRAVVSARQAADDARQAADEAEAPSALTVIDARTTRVHAHNREYWIAVGLVCNGEMKVNAAIAVCNGHGYDLHQVRDLESLPHAVRRQLQQLDQQLRSTFPAHSPELAALSWRTRTAVADQRGSVAEQYETLVGSVADRQANAGNTE
ncbi:MAG: LCCL domain-containing protein [Phycisphaeraceae bacterium]